MDLFLYMLQILLAVAGFVWYTNIARKKEGGLPSISTHGFFLPILMVCSRDILVGLFVFAREPVLKVTLLVTCFLTSYLTLH